jgi:AraC family transcriptional regulator of adaptative response/methylated-DNA-[protein]-cysteine methyltransferase
MIAGSTQNGICLLEFLDRKMIETQLKKIKINTKSEIIPGSHKFFKPLRQQLKEYFKGERKKFTIPLELIGTSFQKKVWTVLQTIPYGSTRSYHEIAQKVENPKAIRAAAKANGDNKIAIIIPCHRVIGQDGQLKGYGGGLWRKQYLINLESKNHA